MARLKVLTSGAGFGSIWVTDMDGVAAAQVGCAVNCADFTMEYQDGVKVFWLHIAYHGQLGRTNWHGRIMAAMSMVLQTLLEGRDVVVHCVQGPHGTKGMHFLKHPQS